MLYGISPDTPASPALSAEMQMIVATTFGGTRFGSNRVQGVHYSIPYTDIALEAAGTVDAGDPLMRQADGGQAMIYWPGGSRTMAGVRVAGISFGSDEATMQAERATIGRLPDVILGAQVGKAALRRWTRRVQATGYTNPEEFLDEDVTAAAQEFCALERVPIGFVTLSNVLTSRGPGRYASLSFISGSFHPKPILGCIQEAIRAGKATAN